MGTNIFDPSYLEPSKPREQIRDDYSALRLILNMALDQSESGKGKERHASGEPWHQQPIIVIGNWLGSNHFELGQAIKKLRESARQEPEDAFRNLLGAIVYAAAAAYMVYLEVEADREEKAKS